MKRIYHTKHCFQDNKNLIKEYKELVDEPTITLEGGLKGQSINFDFKIINKSSGSESENYKVIVQGDAGTTMAIALSSFNTLNEIIHVEG